MQEKISPCTYCRIWLCGGDKKKCRLCHDEYSSFNNFEGATIEELNELKKLAIR